VEKNKGGQESRTIETCAVASEDIGFPFAAQAALLTRQRIGRKDETVALVTSLPPEQLSPSDWLRFNRQGWGIENGLHQRLDVSLNDDRCRVRSTNGLLILGMFRRLTVSLFMEWRHHQPKGHLKSFTDFHAAMGDENLTPAMRFLTTKRPTL
jgi:hypothetical protein